MVESIWVELLGAETRFVDAAGIRTRVLTAGSGPALLLLHGSGGHAEAYARNIIPLSANYQVIAMDYLGSGLTGYPDHAPTLLERVDHVVGVLDALGIDQATIAGESFGGTLAVATTRMYPERVTALISIVGGTFAITTDDDPDGQYERSLRNLVERQRKALSNPSRDTVSQRLAWLFHRPETAISDELIDIRWQFYRRPECQAALADLNELVSNDIEYRFGSRRGEKRDDALNPVTVEQLQEIKHPTLFIWTDHNPSITAATARRAANHIPGAEFVLMTDCGHWPQWEDPQVFNTTVEDFMNRLHEVSVP